MTATMTAPEPLTFDVNGTTLTFQPRTWKHYIPYVCILAGVLLFVGITLCPGLARADILSDITDTINNAINNFMSDTASGIINASMWFINWISPEQLALNDFNNLFGSGSVSLYEMVNDICDYSIKPVAAAVLSLVMLGQLIKIAQRVDANATMPALKEVMVLFFYFLIGMFLVRNGIGLVGDVYDIFRSFIAGITAGTKDIVIDFTPEGFVGDLANLIGILVSSFIVLLAGVIAAVLANAMLLARAIQIYLYAAFAPLMFAFFGLDETRSWSLGFLKGFMAACLSGFIIYFSIAAFPYVVSALLSTSNAVVTDSTITVVASGGDSIGWVVGVAASCAALGLMCLKSGTFAREILGG